MCRVRKGRTCYPAFLFVPQLPSRADRVNASVSIRAKLGKSINGRAPYGYHWKDRTLLPHPEEAPVRRKAYELFLQHRRKGTVAKLLNASGYRTRDGVHWRDMQITRILTDTSAKGLYLFNRGKKHGNWRQAIKPETEWGKVECEPIVPEPLWNQVNQIIEEQLKSRKKPGRLPVQVFGNLAHCACGHKMYVRSNSPKYVCRKCHNKIPIADLDAIVRDELKAFFANPQRIAEHLQAANQNPTAVESAGVRENPPAVCIVSEIEMLVEIAIHGNQGCFFATTRSILGCMKHRDRCGFPSETRARR